MTVPKMFFFCACTHTHTHTDCWNPQFWRERSETHLMKQTKKHT